MTAIVKLPWNLELSSDMTLYSRTGYADSQLNTNDLVWNARLARPFLKGRLVVMLDGFDILGQLDNVTRNVNAQGRTETYTNVMPRYALLHVTYRFNRLPKKTAEKEITREGGCLRPALDGKRWLSGCPDGQLRYGHRQ